MNSLQKGLLWMQWITRSSLNILKAYLTGKIICSKIYLLQFFDSKFVVESGNSRMTFFYLIELDSYRK